MDLSGFTKVCSTIGRQVILAATKLGPKKGAAALAIGILVAIFASGSPDSEEIVEFAPEAVNELPAELAQVQQEQQPQVKLPEPNLVVAEKKLAPVVREPAPIIQPEITQRAPSGDSKVALVKLLELQKKYGAVSRELEEQKKTKSHYEKQQATLIQKIAESRVEARRIQGQLKETREKYEKALGHIGVLKKERDKSSEQIRKLNAKVANATKS